MTRRRGRVDFAGAIAVTSALALAVYAIVTANEPGSGVRTAVLLAISGALFVTFVALQRLRQAPLVNTTYQVGSAIGLAAMVAVAGAKTSSLVATGLDGTAAMNGGFSAAFVGAGAIALGAALLASIAIRVPGAKASDAQARRRGGPLSSARL